MLTDLQPTEAKKVYRRMLSFDNIRKPANKKWKFVSKLLCRILPVISGAIIPLPIPEVAKVWIIFACTVVVAVISAISELTVETNA